jgi:hypothetical protein
MTGGLTALAVGQAMGSLRCATLVVKLNVGVVAEWLVVI